MTTTSPPTRPPRRPASISNSTSLSSASSQGHGQAQGRSTPPPTKPTKGVGTTTLTAKGSISRTSPGPKATPPVRRTTANANVSASSSRPSSSLSNPREGVSKDSTGSKLKENGVEMNDGPDDARGNHEDVSARSPAILVLLRLHYTRIYLAPRSHSRLGQHSYRRWLLRMQTSKPHSLKPRRAWRNYTPIKIGPRRN
jgi:hypothetical protein